MHPALSIVFFTTASGAGFALLLLLGLLVPLGLLPLSASFGFATLVVAVVLAGGGYYGYRGGYYGPGGFGGIGLVLVIVLVVLLLYGGGRIW